MHRRQCDELPEYKIYVLRIIYMSYNYQILVGSFTITYRNERTYNKFIIYRRTSTHRYKWDHASLADGCTPWTGPCAQRCSSLHCKCTTVCAMLCLPQSCARRTIHLRIHLPINPLFERGSDSIRNQSPNYEPFLKHKPATPDPDKNLDSIETIAGALIDSIYFRK
jgi:hypothetical protein